MAMKQPFSTQEFFNGRAPAQAMTYEQKQYSFGYAGKGTLGFRVVIRVNLNR